VKYFYKAQHCGSGSGPGTALNTKAAAERGIGNSHGDYDYWCPGGALDWLNNLYDRLPSGCNREWMRAAAVSVIRSAAADGHRAASKWVRDNDTTNQEGERT